MATNNVNKRKRGRPPGRSEKGRQSQEHLYKTAIRLFSEQGYHQTTLRQIAREAGVSPALLYKYFPSKVSVVLNLYDDLSHAFIQEMGAMPAGTWRERVVFTLEQSLGALRPHRDTMKAFIPVMVVDPEHGLFSEQAAFSRHRVQGQFQRAVAEAKDAPKEALASALGTVIYVLHLGVILWWLMDRSPSQRATGGLVTLLKSLAGPAAMLLKFPGTKAPILTMERLIQDGLFAGLE